MITEKKSPKIFFGWWTVLGTSFATLWGHGFVTQGFSAMFKPIAADLGMSRAETSIASSIGTFQGGVESPITGWVTDKFGPRVVIMFGCFLVGLGLILMKFVNSHWAFYVVWGGIAAGGLNIGLAIPVNKAISNWFVKKRGLALSVRAVFHGLATIAVLPLVTWLVKTVDWRMTCFIGGVVMWVVIILIIWFLVKPHRPEYYGLLPDGATAEAELVSDSGRMITRGVEYAAGVQEIEFTLRQAMRTRAYWLLVLVFSVNVFVTSPIMVHGMPLLTDMGIDSIRAALMFSIAGASAIPTRLASGIFADRVRKEHLRFILVGSSLITAVGMFSFLLNQTRAMAQVMLIAFYMGFTSITIIQPAINARYFGRKSLGSIQGVTSMIMTPFSVLAPVSVGWVYDRTGSYTTVLYVCVVILIFITLVMLFVRPPKPPAVVADINKFL